MPPDKVAVVTGSRLHFGLLGVESQSARSFGGVGLMVEAPAFRLEVEFADRWFADKRALTFAERFAQSVPDARPCRIVVTPPPREHIGLGSGTQLALAISKALSILYGRPELEAVELAQRVGRGARSGLGVHGFQHGGLVVDGGKGPQTGVAPLVARHDFPEEWQIVLSYPGGVGLAGDAERRAFATLVGETSLAERLCALALKGILPALVERDLPSFGEALYEFNRAAGELFRVPQGGIYASERTGQFVEFIRDLGVRGAGQSSWGPTVFAIVETDQAAWLKEQITEKFNLRAEDITVTSAANQGARMLL